MEPIRIDFNKPCLTGKEFEYMAQALQAGHISGDGLFTRRCSEFLQELLHVARVLLTTSCTHALELAAFLLELEPGDEVILPSFTFVSTANAFVVRGARPIFVDIRTDTLNLDEQLLEAKITTRTRAIVPVHYAGVGCEMGEIMKIAGRYNLVVIEDNAHGLFGNYRYQPLGTFGRLATLSFHETKNITCGEGGALMINDPTMIEKAEIIREKGTNRSRFFRGQVDKYTWVSQGSSYLPSDILAAFLLAQLESYREIQTKRRQVWEYYYAGLKDWAIQNAVRLPIVPPDCSQAFHMFYLLMPDLEHRQGLINYLRQKGIYSVFHYLPLHLSEMGRIYGGRPGDCPVTEKVSDQLLRLPFYNDLQLPDLDIVIQAVCSYCC